MDKKDYFSRQSQAYAAFRPSYPPELYDSIFRHLTKRTLAWDCATGNGQVAQYLAKSFQRVFATDISQKQLDNAAKADNIIYSVSAAEKSSFDVRQFDLITVAQALHWFNLPEFYREVKRTAAPGGLLAVWGYSMLTIDADIDELFLHFYHDIVGPYWDDARRHVENHYRDLSFPFTEIPTPPFFIRAQWSRHQFIGYLSSWSATQRYIEANRQNPLDAFEKRVSHVWKDEDIKVVTFPIFMKLGRIDSNDS